MRMTKRVLSESEVRMLRLGLYRLEKETENSAVQRERREKLIHDLHEAEKVEIYTEKESPFRKVEGRTLESDLQEDR